MKVFAGKAVVEHMKDDMTKRVEALKAKGVTPTLAIVRCGEREDDLAYERGATKRCESVGVAVKVFALPVDVSEARLIETLEEVNNDKTISGCLLFRPLPDHLDDAKIRNVLVPEKDVDGITDESMSGVYSGSGKGYAPCTAAACIKICDHYGVELKGKRVVIIGRSLVVGKPLAMLALGRHATVTTCHTRTIDMPSVVREAEVVFVAAGRPELIGKEYFSEGQIVIDVGIHFNDEGKMVGDVKRSEAEQVVAALTPVPGGVGTVTTSTLVQNVVEAAEKANS